MSTYKWSIPSGKEITGSTYLKDTDNYIGDTIIDNVKNNVKAKSNPSKKDEKNNIQ